MRAAAQQTEIISPVIDERQASQRLVTVQAACTILTLSKGTVYKLLAKGHLKGVMICGARRITLESVNSLIANGTGK